jgi:bifunctional oligoribonuclease and PAP phosphatase NrnA
VTERTPPAPPAEADWREVVELLREADYVCLACHVNPDGDALGSAVAVGLALRELGIRVEVSFGDDPPAVPRSLSFLPGLELLVPPGDVPAAPDVVMVFDAASIDRLGLLAGKARAAGALVVVDHHTSNTRFGTHHLVDVTAPATAVLVEGLIRRLGVKLSQEIATAIYAGLASDTGSFRYTGTTSATHHLAARLLDAGVQQDLISRQLWDTASFGYLKVLARALEGTSLEPAAAGGLGLVWTVVTRADRDAFGVELDEIEGVIDVVRKASEAEVAVVFKEDANGSYRVSARSKGRADVGAVCTALGGGGHRLAAGFTTKEGTAVTLSRVLGLLGAAGDGPAGDGAAGDGAAGDGAAGDGAAGAGHRR